MSDSYEGRTLPSSLLQVSFQVEFEDHSYLGGHWV